MQQTKSYWRLVAVASVVSAFVASACVVTTGDGDDDGSSAGEAGAAGAHTAGAANAGAGAAGSAGSAGAHAGAAGLGAGEGGAPPTSFQCDPAEGGAVGTPYGCEPDDVNDSCQTCIQSKCCSEYSACNAYNPGNQCGWGGPAKLPSGKDYPGGEAICIQQCIKEGVEASGTDPDAELVGTCAAGCMTAKDTSGASCEMSIGLQTDDLIRCMRADCSKVCFGPVD